MRIGQPVTVTRALYGGQVELTTARSQGSAFGTGAAVRAVPAQNATGKWIKVVQRGRCAWRCRQREWRRPTRCGFGLSTSASVECTILPERQLGAGDASGTVLPTSVYISTRSEITARRADNRRESPRKRRRRQSSFKVVERQGGGGLDGLEREKAGTSSPGTHRLRSAACRRRHRRRCPAHTMRIR